jgi:hypothetical protein
LHHASSRGIMEVVRGVQYGHGRATDAKKATAGSEAQQDTHIAVTHHKCLPRRSDLT